MTLSLFQTNNRQFFNTRNLYILMIAAIAAWSLVGYFIVQTSIEQQKSYSELINLSGKQRMLSQRLALLTEKLYLHDATAEISQQREHLIQLMRSDFLYITHNLKSEGLKALYFSGINPVSAQVMTFLELLEQAPLEQPIDYVDRVYNSATQLLGTLDSAVSALQHESEQYAVELQRQEYLILTGTLLILVIEASLIILPSFKRIFIQEQQAKSLFNQLPLPIVYIDAKSGRLTQNCAFRDVTGYTARDIPTLNCWFEKAYPTLHDHAAAIQRWKQCVRDAQNKDGLIKGNQYSVTYQDGSIHQVIIEGRILGEGYVVTFHDVTKESAIKQDLIRTAEHLKQAQAVANLGSWQLDLTNNELIWSDHIYKIFERASLISSR